MKFDNRPPIALESAEIIATAGRSGGAYDGIGYTTYTVYRGKRLHLVYAHSSGCDYGSGADHTCTHLGHWQTVEDLGQWLRQQTEQVTFVDDTYAVHDCGTRFPWWASKLLADLGYAGEEA